MKFRSKIDFKAINAAALAQLPALCAHWLPDGKRRGREFVARNPRREDRRAGSFSVNLDTGRWADFAVGACGGDPVSLAVRGRNVLTDSDELPCLSVLEALNPDRFPRRAGTDDVRDAPLHREGWVLLVQGWAVDDKVNPSDPAYRLMADVKKALAKLMKGPNPMTGQGGHVNFLLGGLNQVKILFNSFFLMIKPSPFFHIRQKLPLS